MSEIDRIIGRQLSDRRFLEEALRRAQDEETRRRAELLPEVLSATTKFVHISAKYNYPGSLPIVGGHAVSGWQVLRQPPETQPYYGLYSHGILGDFKPGLSPHDSMIAVDGHFYDVYVERNGWDSTDSLLTSARPIYGYTMSSKTVNKLFSSKQEIVKTKLPSIKPETIAARGLQDILFTIGHIVVTHGMETDWQTSNAPKRIRRT